MLQTLTQRFFTFPSISVYLFSVTMPPDAIEAGKADGEEIWSG